MKTQIETELNNLRELAASISGGSLHLNDAIANLESLLAEPAPFKLEIGKRYVTRDGRVTSPLVANTGTHRATHPFKWVVSKTTHCEEWQPYTESGSAIYGTNANPSEYDLVSEYPEDPETIGARQCDTIRELESIIMTARPKADCYDRICAQLGIANDVLGYVNKLESRIRYVEQQLVDSDASVNESNKRFATIKDQQSRIAELQSLLDQRDGIVAERGEIIDERDARIASLESDNQNLRSALQIVCAVKPA